MGEASRDGSIQADEILGASLRGGCDSVTAAAPALPERNAHGNTRASKHHTRVTHLSSSFAALNAPSLSLTTTGREPDGWPATNYNAQDKEGPRNAPVVSLISANTNFHRRGLAEETVGDAYLTSRDTHCSEGERERGGGRITAAAVRREGAPWQELCGRETTAVTASRPWTVTLPPVHRQTRIFCQLIS